MAPPKAGFRARFREWIGDNNSPKKNEQKLSLKEEVISKKEYVLEATRQVLEILKSAAGLAPIPLMKEALELGINVLNLCQSISKVTEQIESLRDRMTELLLVVAKVAKEFPVNLKSTSVGSDTNHLLGDLGLLCRCLNEIHAKLQKIAAQNRVLTTFLPQASQGVIEECTTQFKEAITRFQVLRALRDSLDLSRIRGQLVEVYGLNKVVAANVADIRDEVQEVKGTVNAIHAFLQSNAAENRLPVVTKAPRAPDIFIGRDAYVDRIVLRLMARESSPSRICVLGPGGAGKTAVASAIAHHARVKERFTSCFWASCITSTSSTAFLSTLCHSIGVQSQVPSTLSAAIEHLERKGEPCLLVLDNFETAWHPIDGAQKPIKDILEALDALEHLSILVTMRSEFPPLPHWSGEVLPALQVEDSRLIYTSLNNEEEATEGDPSALNSLLAALGHLPYAVTLMATRAKASLSSPAELLAEWNESGTSMITTAEGGMDHSIRLSLQSRFVRSSPGATRLLQVLSMLPTGVDRSELGSWVKDWKTEALDTLRNAALVQTTTYTVVDKGGRVKKAHRLSVLPVVQSYMNHGDRIPSSVRDEVHHACYRILSRLKAAMVSPDHPGFRDAFACLDSHQDNMLALIPETLKHELNTIETRPGSPSFSDEELDAASERRAFMLDSVLSFIRYQQWSKTNYMIICKPAMDLSRKTKNYHIEAEIWFSILDGIGTPRLASVTDRHRQIADHYRSIGGYQKTAVVEYQGLYQVSCALLAMPEPNRVEKVSRRLEDLNVNWEPYYDVHGEEAQPIKAAVLYGSAKIRVTLDVVSQRQQAVKELREAEIIFTQLKKPYQASLCSLSLGFALGLLGQYGEAMTMADEAISCFKDLAFGESGMAQNIASACFVKIASLKLLGRWDDPELMVHIDIAKRVFQDILGLSIPLAMIFDDIGEVHIKKGEWNAARKAYREAVDWGKQYMARNEDDGCNQERLRKWEENLEFAVAKESGSDDGTLTWHEPHRF